MSRPAVAIDLADPRNNGIHLLQRNALASLLAAIRQTGLHAVRIPLAERVDKAAILAAFAEALQFPLEFGQNWDALADYLDDLCWLPTGGKVLFLDGTSWTLADPPREIAVLLSILAETATRASRRGEPWHVLLPLEPA